MHYENWRYSTVTSQAATDAGMGTPLLTTGTKPRVIHLLSCFWGTNTTTSINMRYFVIAETSVPADGNNQYSLALYPDETFPLGFASADMAGGTPNALNPMVSIGIGAKGQSNEQFVLPPNSLLIAAPSINQNGTIIHKVISAEISGA